MRYTEQLKSSLGYHWSIFREIWDMFTLRNWHWLVVGLWIGLGVLPLAVTISSSTIGCYIETPVPVFDPSIPQDIAYELAATVYCSKAIPVPSTLAVVSYHWVKGSGFRYTGVLWAVSVALILANIFREGRPVRGREEQKEGERRC